MATMQPMPGGKPDEPMEGAPGENEAAENEQGGDAHEALEQIEQQIRGKIPAKDRAAVDRIVMAGQKFIFSPQTNAIAMKQIQTGAPESVGQGVAALLSILQKESKGTMPPEAVMPAAILLLVEALRFLLDAGEDISAEFIGEATKALMGYMMQKAGVKPPAELAPQGQPGQPPQQPQQPQGGPGLIQQVRGM